MKTLSSLLMPDTLDDSPPMVGGFRLRVNQIAYWCWCLMLFFIPFSTALGLLMSALAIVSGLLGFSLQSFKKTFKQPAIILCVLLFGWLTLSMLWSIAPKAEMLEAWSKYRKLLYPALVMMVLYNLRRGSSDLVYGFLAGCGVVALVSLFSASGILEIFIGAPQVAGGWYIGPGWLFIGGPDNPTFGRNHITQSAFLVFAAMLCLGEGWSAAYRANSIRKASPWLALAGVYLQPVFLLQSRTGYLLVIILTVYWMYVALRYLRLRHGLMCVGIFGLLIGLMVTTSPHILSRTKVMTESVRTYVGQGDLRDSGVRLEFWKSGLNIFAARPLHGVGIGAYAQAYEKLPGRPEWLSKSRPHPHSEYVLQATQGGLIGVSLFLLIAVACILRAKKATPETPALFGLILLFLVDAAVNSVIWDFAEGHLFVLVAVVALPQSLVIRVKANELIMSSSSQPSVT